MVRVEPDNPQNMDVTVAGLCAQDGRILVVHEHASSRVVLNLPGGHIEAAESPEDAVVREVREETGLAFQPTHLLGCYIWTREHDGKRYLRIVYGGELDVAAGPAVPVTDPNIVASDWLSPTAILAAADDHRYPIVQRSIEDFLAGVREPRRSLRPFLPIPSHLDAVTRRASVLS